MLWGIHIGSLSELLMVTLTLVATAANIFLWFTTRESLQILIKQVNHQIASEYSSAQFNIVDAHRQLFFGILANPALIKAFTEANDLNPKTWTLEKISEFLINQALVCYLNFTNGIISSAHFEGFKRDARSLFDHQSVRAHWEKIKPFHSMEFCRFVETELL
ncbi:MAG: hypothetical protein AAGA75_00600 [Cyanobacteria bacterium P01_E01_bin.6]